MKKRMGRVLCLFLAVVALVTLLSVQADAAVKITIKNNRSHTLSFAFCWAGMDYEYDVSKGWYNVKAGESRTMTFSDAQYSFTSSNFGYYATGGGSTWRGENDSSGYMTFWINPTKAFTGSHDNSISGGKKVVFRKINLKRTGDSQDASATLTFNP